MPLLFCLDMVSTSSADLAFLGKKEETDEEGFGGCAAVFFLFFLFVLPIWQECTLYLGVFFLSSLLFFLFSRPTSNLGKWHFSNSVPGIKGGDCWRRSSFFPLLRPRFAELIHLEKRRLFRFPE